MNKVRHTVAPHRLALIALAGSLLLGLSACTEMNRSLARAEGKPPTGPERASQIAQEAAPEPIPAPQEKPKPGRLYEWSGDGRKISRIVVNTDEQRARFYDGDEQIGWTTVASGISSFPTPTGNFEVLEKVANKRSNLYGKIYGAGGKVVRSDAKAGRDPIPEGARFEGAHMPYFLRLTNDGIGLHAGPIPRPGRPASHGCIRMPSKLAPVLFEHVDLGTKVSIVGSGPSYGNYVQKQRALAARERERREAAARAQAVAAEASPAPVVLSPMEPTPSDPGAEPAGTTASAPAPVDAQSVPHLPVAAAQTPAGPAPQTAAQSKSQAAEASSASQPTPPATAPTPWVHSAAPGTPPPPPGAPILLAPVGPTSPYLPPVRPAAATLPAPATAQPAPLAAPTPVTTPEAPPPAGTPSAAPNPSPAPPPGVSVELPTAGSEPNEG